LRTPQSVFALEYNELAKFDIERFFTVITDPTENVLITIRSAQPSISTHLRSRWSGEVPCRSDLTEQASCLYLGDNSHRYGHKLAEEVQVLFEVKPVSRMARNPTKYIYQSNGKTLRTGFQAQKPNPDDPSRPAPGF